jgi:hypothetical protein
MMLGTTNIKKISKFQYNVAETTTVRHIEKASLVRRKTENWYETTNRRRDVI